LPDVAIKPEQVLRGSPETAFSCLYYAVMNFFVWAGAEAPALDDLRAYIARHRGEQAARVDEPESVEEWAGMGISVVDALALLHEFGFPRLAALAVMPKGRTARDVLPPLLSRGCGVLFAYRWERWGQVIGHAGVACGWSDEWVEFMDSDPAFFTGRLKPFADDGSAFDAEEIQASLALPHGALSRLGWLTLADDTPPLHLGQGGGPVGVERAFVLALPEVKS
jgi:hypothetical protein